jgi:hypothetical protein
MSSTPDSETVLPALPACTSVVLQAADVKAGADERSHWSEDVMMADVKRARRTVACIEPKNAERMARVSRRKAVKTRAGGGRVERRDVVKWI